MQNRPQITRVVLENYKSIAFCDVKLGPLAVLVGPNGAGKSNFLDALRFLSEAMNNPVERAFQTRGGFSSVLRRGTPPEAHLGMRIDFVTSDGNTGRYSVRFSRGSELDYMIEREKCSIDGRGGFDLRHGARYADNQLLDLPGTTEPPHFRAVWNLLSNCQFYNFSSKDFRQPVPKDWIGAGTSR